MLVQRYGLQILINYLFVDFNSVQKLIESKPKEKEDYTVDFAGLPVNLENLN